MSRSSHRRSRVGAAPFAQSLHRSRSAWRIVCRRSCPETESSRGASRFSAARGKTVECCDFASRTLPRTLRSRAAALQAGLRIFRAALLSLETSGTGHDLAEPGTAESRGLAADGSPNRGEFRAPPRSPDPGPRPRGIPSPRTRPPELRLAGMPGSTVDGVPRPPP